MCLIPNQFLLLLSVIYKSNDPGSVADSPVVNTDVTVSGPASVASIRKADSDTDSDPEVPLLAQRNPMLLAALSAEFVCLVLTNTA